MTTTLIEQLRRHIPSAEVSAVAVSGWSVGMHLHHCGVAMIGICDALHASTGPQPKAPFSLPRYLLLTTGWIPRGRAKSPESAVPPRQVDPAALGPLIDSAETKLRQAQALNDTKWFDHPLLGSMSRKTALRFIDIHNRHHLKIVNDILAAR